MKQLLLLLLCLAMDQSSQALIFGSKDRKTEDRHKLDGNDRCEIPAALSPKNPWGKEKVEPRRQAERRR